MKKKLLLIPFTAAVLASPLYLKSVWTEGDVHDSKVAQENHPSPDSIENTMLSSKENHNVLSESPNSNLTKLNHDGVNEPDNFLAVELNESIELMSSEEISVEIEMLTGLVERYDLIDAMNNDTLSPEERQTVNEVLQYLTQLRLANIDHGLIETENEIEVFRQEIQSGVYPSPQPISDSYAAAVKDEYLTEADVKNDVLNKEINRLASRTKEDDLADIGL